MHNFFPVVAVVAIVLGAMLAPAALPATAQHHAAHHATAPATIAAQRWPTDAPLRTGMADIRATVDALRHFEHAHIGPQQAATLATRIENQVAYLVSNCRLEPQADAALHAILGRLLQGAAALKADSTDTAAVATLRQALQEYPRQFDDPGWSSTEPEED